jgi:hypothetical protein
MSVRGVCLPARLLLVTSALFVACTKIARWREYEVESPLDWEQLAGESYF